MRLIVRGTTIDATPLNTTRIGLATGRPYGGLRELYGLAFETWFAL